MQSRIKHLLKHFALVLKAKLNQLKPFVRFVFQSSALLHPPTYRIIKGLHIQTFFMLLYASFSCPYFQLRTAPTVPTRGRSGLRTRDSEPPELGKAEQKRTPPLGLEFDHQPCIGARGIDLADHAAAELGMLDALPHRIVA